MKCHYQVLDITIDADDAQIKTAYRKLALKWHPDKNLDNCEYAKTEFQFVQQAYEVLSDRQERAWYDKHREQILCGSSEFKDSDLNIFQYFTSSCFKSYTDDKNGFYSVYRKAFEEIVQDDIQHMLDKEELLEIPTFGSSTSDYDEVVGPFYDYWTCYSTKKSFIWLDHYNIQEVRDRRILKLMEKEHKKIRQKAKKEWNDEVRALVAFVRKRDKRVKEFVKIREAKILENRQKNEELSKQKRLERKKLLNESQDSQPEWSKFDNVKNELEQIEKSLAEEFGEQISEDEDEENCSDPEIDNLYCVACNKVFKSPKAFENHELSKKHRENVSKLKDIMEDEDNSENEVLNDILPEQALSHESENDNSSGICELSDTPIQEVKKGAKLKRKQKKVQKVVQASISEDDCFLKTENIDDFKFEPSKKQKKNRKSKTSEKIPSQNPCNNGEINCNAERLQSEESNAKLNGQGTRQTHQVNTESQETVSNRCATCNADFPSKNKLFNHLKKTGHTVYLPQATKCSRNKNLDK